MKVVLFGGSGFLGGHLIAALSASGHHITLVTRRPPSEVNVVSPGIEVKSWFPPEGLSSILDGAEGVVNLIGESIGAKRWSIPRKQVILSSRVDSTRAIVDAIAKTHNRPNVLLNASAVGYYGNVESEVATEERPPGEDFLATVCARWEDEARKAGKLGVRVVMLRSGLVLAKDAEAFRKMVLPFKLLVGGTLGSGQQWFPWIHVHDEIGAMIHLLEKTDLSGPVNLVAPEAVTMKQFCSSLGGALHKPSWAPVPAFVLRAILGEMANALVLRGQKAGPAKLLRSGFTFKFPNLEQALVDILK